MATKIHSRFFKLLSQLPGTNKETIVYAYSNKRTASLSEFYSMDIRAYNYMINDLQTRINNALVDEKALKKLRSAILHRLQKHGVDTTDWNKVNRFLEQPKIAGKRLYNMTIEDMQQLIPKLESILQKDNKEAEKIKRLSLLN